MFFAHFLWSHPCGSRHKAWGVSWVRWCRDSDRDKDRDTPNREATEKHRTKTKKKEERERGIEGERGQK